MLSTAGSVLECLQLASRVPVLRVLRLLVLLRHPVDAARLRVLDLGLLLDPLYPSTRSKCRSAS